MERYRILIVNDDDELRDKLKRALHEQGHAVIASRGSRAGTTTRRDSESFDLTISYQASEAKAANGKSNGKLPLREILHPGNPSAQTLLQPLDVSRTFKIDATRLARRSFDKQMLRDALEAVLRCKLRFDELVRPSTSLLQEASEQIELALPSDIGLMSSVLNYLTERVAQFGIVEPEHSNLFIALDEAFVNAIKHGNRYDSTKIVRISAELNNSEARFDVEDEGAGFVPSEIPDPCAEENLFKTSGRGVLLIYSIMDEVSYNACGNKLTMIKRARASDKDAARETKLIDSHTLHQDDATNSDADQRTSN